MADEKRETGGPGHLLASFYKKIHAELGIRQSLFVQIMDRYTRRVNLNKEISTNALSSARSNLRKELFKSTMSWRVFIKGLQVLNVKRLDIKITLHHSNKRKTVHDMSIMLKDQESDIEEVKDDVPPTKDNNTVSAKQLDTKS